MKTGLKSCDGVLVYYLTVLGVILTIQQVIMANDSYEHRFLVCSRGILATFFSCDEISLVQTPLACPLNKE